MTSPADTTPEAVATLVAEAAVAAQLWAAADRADRAASLRAVADGLDEKADPLIALASRETHLTDARLRGELKRTSFQLRFFADIVEDGSYLGVTIDHADDDWPMGAPRPDLRRTMRPVGPVVVFAASNFPFAFSVVGGDTASALAAGCPVIVKAHPGHPELSAATAAVAMQALTSVGAPPHLLSLIFGVEAGLTALRAPQIKAGSFTGSIPGGRALFDVATSRPEPIPFFGELGSVNPVFVTRTAAQTRSQDIVDGYITSFTMSAGQFCTKPGVLLAPLDSEIPRLLNAAALPSAASMLNDQIEAGYRANLTTLSGQPAVTVVNAADAETSEEPPSPTVLQTTVDALVADPESLFVECFGPAVLLATYSDERELLAVAHAIDGQLTATIFGEDDDAKDGALISELVAVLADRAGRLLWNQWPTGVSVTHAQQHGGPYPATTTPGTTSVGGAAIERFLRPVAYQSFPATLLPAELREEAAVPKRIDGRYCA